MSAQVSNKANYCILCGMELVHVQRFGSVRPVCPNCDWVYFPDPKVAAAALILQEGRVLLVRRANDPQRGMWTLPAGFVDAGEDPARAVERECLEETGLQVRVTGLVDVIYGLEHERGAHILIVYKAETQYGELRPGDDVDHVAYYFLDALPPLAFNTTKRVLAKLMDLNIDT